MSAYRFIQERVSAKDGKKLMTRVIFPLSYKAGDKLPCVCHRTPYDAKIENYPFDPNGLGRTYCDFLDRGYIVVSQQCRGTASSEGEFHNMTHEREDGLALLEWVRGREWYNGEIFLWGNSYCSFVMSVMLDANPEGVRGAALAVMPAHMALGCYEKNTFKHDLLTMWFAKTYKVNHVDTALVYKRMAQELKKRPLRELTKRVYGEDAPELVNAFTHAPNDAYWMDMNSDHGHCYNAPMGTNIPLLLVGGLYDIHFKGTLEYWRAIPKAHRAHCAALFGPWTHGMNTLPEHKPLFPGSSHPPVEAEWFDHLRCGQPLNYVDEGKFTYYLPGEGWRREENPWAEVGNAHRLYMNAGKESEGVCSEADAVSAKSADVSKAAGREGAAASNAAASADIKASPASEAIAAGSVRVPGTLDISAAPAVGLSYVFDPNDPLTLPGGASVFQTPLRGPQEQPVPCFRQDLLSFVSAKIKEPLKINGPVRVSLSVSSDCPDTAFFVRINLIRAGHTLCLRDTIVSVSELVRDYVPGSRARLDFTLDPVVFRLNAGDALRLDVSSSDFPCYNVHANTLEPWYDAVETRVAHNTVFAGESFIEF